MKYYVIAMVMALSFAGCAKGDKGDMGLQGLPGVVPALPAVPTDTVAEDIAKIIKDENAYRLGLGQAVLSGGLTGNLYTVTGGDRIQASIAGHNTLQGVTHVGSFLLSDVINQLNSPVSEGMSVLPPAMRAVYKNMYLLRLTGVIVIQESGYHGFELTSDDGSVLYVDGAKLIDNDNNHGAVTVSASKYLRRGVHSIRLDYAQTGAGSQALILNHNGALLSPSLMFH